MEREQTIIVCFPFQPCTALGSLHRHRAGFSPLARLKVVGFYIQLSILAFAPKAFIRSAPMDSPEVAEVDCVFALAFSASDQFVAYGIRKYFVNEEPSIWAVDFPQCQAVGFPAGKFQPVQIFRTYHRLVLGPNGCIHCTIPSFPNPISRTMYASALRLSYNPSCLSLMKKAV